MSDADEELRGYIYVDHAHQDNKWHAIETFDESSVASTLDRITTGKNRVRFGWMVNGWTIEKEDHVDLSGPWRVEVAKQLRNMHATARAALKAAEGGGDV